MPEHIEYEMGKSPAWWFFVWPFKRREIRHYYEGGCFDLSVMILKKYIPESSSCARSIVSWLARKYRWKIWEAKKWEDK